MKKIVFCIIIFFSFASVLAFSSVQINAAENRGTCGDNLTWSYDSKSRTLSITGTGKMYDFDYSDNPNGVYSPWNKFSKKIINVTFSKGITSVGNCAFYQCSNLKKIEIPEGVTSIGMSRIIREAFLLGGTFISARRARMEPMASMTASICSSSALKFSSSRYSGH